MVLGYVINFSRHELHVIVDEIYALSVFEGTFTSVAALDVMPDPSRTHFVWGFSKVLTYLLPPPQGFISCTQILVPALAKIVSVVQIQHNYVSVSEYVH